MHEARLGRTGHVGRISRSCRAMATGAAISEIAVRLFVGEARVKSHMGAIFSELAVRDRAGVIVFAYQHGVALT